MRKKLDGIWGIGFILIALGAFGQNNLGTLMVLGGLLCVFLDPGFRVKDES